MYKLGVILSVAFVAVVLSGEQRPKPLKTETVTSFGRVKVKFNEKWVDLGVMARSARMALKEKDAAPPEDVKPVFDFFPGEKSFLRVMFPQGIGKRCWYVEYDKDGKVLEAGSVITKG